MSTRIYTVAELRHIEAQAARWTVELSASEPLTEADTREFQAWIAEDPRHQIVLNKLMRIWEHAGIVFSRVAGKPPPGGRRQ